MLDDKEIVDLYWERSERAITETDKKYGRYCHYIAYQILADNEDEVIHIIRIQPESGPRPHHTNPWTHLLTNNGNTSPCSSPAATLV